MVAFRVALLLCLIPGFCTVANAATPPLRSVRFGQHKTFARVVFDLQERGPYRVVAGATPDTILLEFPAMQQLPDQTVWLTKNPLVRSVRFSAGPTNVQAEINLRRPGRVHKHFRMGTPERIVLDITEPQSATSDQASVSPRTPPPRPQSSRQAEDRTGEDARPKSEPQPVPRTSAPGSQEPSPPPQPSQEPVPPSTPKAIVPSPQKIARLTAQPKELPISLSAEQLLRKAEREWEAKTYEAAELSYKTFLVRFPKHERNHLIATRLADILREQEKNREALDAYAQVVEIYPNREGALISKIRMAELHVAVPEFVPDMVATNETRYMPYYAPLPTLQQLIQDYPLHSLADVARYTVGVILLERDDVSGALDVLQYLLGRSLTAILRQQAEAKLREALERMVTSQVGQGEYFTALRTFFTHKEALAPADVRHPRLVLPVAQSYTSLGLLDEATHLLQMLLDTDSLTPDERAEVALEHANVLFKNGQLAEAKAELRALEQLPDDAVQRHSVRRTLGEIALQEQRPAEAANYFQPLEELFDSVHEQARMQARLAQAYESQGETGQALQLWQQCTELATQDEAAPLPVAEDCLFHTGRLHFVQQRYQQVLAVYDTLLQQFPESRQRDWVLFHMAESARRLEDEPRMLESLKALEEGAQSPFWQRIAREYTDDVAWRERFHERLAEFHNALTR